MRKKGAVQRFAARLVAAVMVITIVMGTSDSGLIYQRISQNNVYSVSAQTQVEIGTKDKSSGMYKSGSSYWPTSGLREWLNSTKNYGLTRYTNAGYYSGSGFLTEFTKSELDAVAKTKRLVHIHSAYGTAAYTAGSQDNLLWQRKSSSGVFNTVIPNLLNTWKNTYHQLVTDGVFILSPHELEVYITGRGVDPKKAATDYVKERHNLSSAYIPYTTSGYASVATTNSPDTVWAISEDGAPEAVEAGKNSGVAPALTLSPDYTATLVTGEQRLVKTLQAGDRVLFGRFKGEEIAWTVINKFKTSGHVLIWSDKVLDFKPYSVRADVIYRDSVTITDAEPDIDITEDLGYSAASGDNTPPVISLTNEAELETPVDGELTLRISAVDNNGIDRITCETGDGINTAGDTLDYKVTQNGLYTFSATDLAGNVSYIEIAVGNIVGLNNVEFDLEPENGWTTHKVRVTTATTRHLSQWVPNNWTHAQPTVTGQPFSKNTSYAGVEFRLKGEVRIGTVPNSDGEAVLRFSYNKIVKENGIYTIQPAQDDALTIPLRALSPNKVKTFDETITIPTDYFSGLTPELGIRNTSGTGHSLIWQNVSVTPSEPDTGYYIKTFVMPNGNTKTNLELFVDEINPKGTHVYTATDTNGKVFSKSVTIKTDKKPPVLSVVKNSVQPDPVRVALTVTATDYQGGFNFIQKPNGEKDIRNSFTYYVYENGVYEFTAIDLAGNKTTRTIEVTEILRNGLELEVTRGELDKELRQQTLTAIAVSDAGVKSITLPDGAIVKNQTEAVFIATKNGVYTFVVEDVLGNKKAAEVIVTGFDTTPPVMTHILSEEAVTSDDVLITVTAADESGIAYILNPCGRISDATKAVYTATENGTYVFKAADTWGNITELAVVVSNIDKQIIINHPLVLDFNIDPNKSLTEGEFKGLAGAVLPIEITNARDFAVDISVKQIRSITPAPELVPLSTYADWNALTRTQTESTVYGQLRLGENKLDMSALNAGQPERLGRLPGHLVSTVEYTLITGRAWEKPATIEQELVLIFRKAK